jgi:hypothetical protein
MIVYHGSDSNFKQLKISKSLVKSRSTEVNEGYGIYFSTDIEVAKSYGKYIYTLEINDKVLHDFRRHYDCITYMTKLISMLEDETGVNLFAFINVDNMIDRMHYGGIQIFNIATEITKILDNMEYYYRMTNETQRRKVTSVLKKYTKNTLKAYLFTYNIPNVGVIKDVDPSVVKIINKQQRHEV